MPASEYKTKKTSTDYSRDSMNIKTHTFCGVKYDIDLETCRGYCDNPKGGRPTIYAPQDEGSEYQRLYVAVHESMHGCDWNKPEAWVTEASKDITRFLFRLGYRKTM